MKEQKFKRNIRDMMFALCGAGICGAVIAMALGDYKSALIVALTTAVVGAVLWMEM